MLTKKGKKKTVWLDAKNKNKKPFNIKPTADFERNSEQRIEKTLSNLLEQAS